MSSAVFFLLRGHFSALVSSWSTKWKGPLRAQKSTECLVPDGCSCGAGNQAQLTIVALVDPVAQGDRPADNTRWTAKWTLGFHGIPAGSRACKKQRYEAIKRSWGCSRKTQSMGSCDVMYSLRALPASSNGVGFDTRKTNTNSSAPLPTGRQKKQLFDPWVATPT